MKKQAYKKFLIKKILSFQSHDYWDFIRRDLERLTVSELEKMYYIERIELLCCISDDDENCFGGVDDEEI